MRIGVHVSITGKIYEAVDRAADLGCTAMQIFSRNPRSWRAAPLREKDVDEFKKRRNARGIDPVVVHVPYILNLATPDDRLYRLSIRSYIEDIRRADSLGAGYVVTHLGSHVGSGLKRGIERFTGALREILSKARPKAMILLEITAGSGSWLGYRFEHIRDIMRRAGDPRHVGACVDTAHMYAAGYDIRSKQGLADAFSTIESLVGFDRVKVIHFNDSKAALGSGVDRHEHIGKGTIGRAALARFINHPLVRNAIFILETPKQSDRDDRRNLGVVRSMIRGR